VSNVGKYTGCGDYSKKGRNAEVDVTREWKAEKITRTERRHISSLEENGWAMRIGMKLHCEQ